MQHMQQWHHDSGLQACRSLAGWRPGSAGLCIIYLLWISSIASSNAAMASIHAFTLKRTGAIAMDIEAL